MHSVLLCVLCGDDTATYTMEFTEADQITNLAHRGQG